MKVQVLPGLGFDMIRACRFDIFAVALAYYCNFCAAYSRRCRSFKISNLQYHNQVSSTDIFLQLFRLLGQTIEACCCSYLVLYEYNTNLHPRRSLLSLSLACLEVNLFGHQTNPTAAH